MRTCWVGFSVFILTMGVVKADPSTDAMKTVNSGFVKVLDECKRELHLSDSVMADLFHFWKLDFDLLKRDTGCIIICMSKKLDLIDASGKLHHGNAQEFAMKHGAEEGTASKLVTALKECEAKSEGIEDDCLRALEMSKCFRKRVVDLNWAPKVEYIVEEVLTEV